MWASFGPSNTTRSDRKTITLHRRQAIQCHASEIFNIAKRRATLQQNHLEFVIQQSYIARDFEIAAIVANLADECEKNTPAPQPFNLNDVTNASSASSPLDDQRR